MATCRVNRTRTNSGSSNEGQGNWIFVTLEEDSGEVLLEVDAASPLEPPYHGASSGHGQHSRRSSFVKR